jgi:hypothetical protein
MNSDGFGGITIVQNGGTHNVSNLLHIAGAAASSTEVDTGRYYLNGGTLSAGAIDLDASGGDAAFIQTNGVAQVGEIQAGGDGAFYVPDLDLSGGTLAATNIYITDGGSIQRHGRFAGGLQHPERRRNPANWRGCQCTAARPSASVSSRSRE